MVLVTVGVYFALSRSLARTLLTAKEEAAKAVGQLFASNVSAAVVFEDAEQIEEALKHLGGNPDVTFAAVWSGTEDKLTKQLGSFARSGHRQSSRPGPGNAPRLTRAEDTLSLSIPVRDVEAKIIAHGLIEFSLANENAKIAATRQRVLWTSGSVAVAVALLLLVVSRRTVVLPLRRLQAGARQLERGDSALFDIQSGDEVGELAQALTQMAGAIRAREEEIKRRNGDMQLVMNNVGQGFLTLNAQGVMSDEYSRVVEQWFGKPEPAERFTSYLARIDKRFADHFALAFDQLMENVFPVELALDQAPKRLVHQQRTWNFEYRPILVDDGQAAGLVVVISDVTHLLEKAAAERAQQEVVLAMTRMTRDPQGFLDFLKETEALLRAIAQPEQVDASAVFRHVHTLKGNCATMDVKSMVELCHELEERLLEPDRILSADEKTALHRCWADYIERIRPVVSSIDGQGLWLEHQRYLDFLLALESDHPRQALLEEARSWSFEDCAKPLARLAEHAQKLALRLGKGELVTKITSSGIRVPRGACGDFWAVLVHAVRNAVDHGLETPSERELAGKPATGRLELSTYWQGDHLAVTVSDDGRGIDWAAVRQHAKRLGLASETEADLERALFAQSLTTRADASETSGRGIGTAALLAKVKELGGRIEIESRSGLGTTFRFLIPKSRIFQTEEFATSARESKPPRPGGGIENTHGASA
jgi:signal transduction histidine kinase